MIDYSFEFTTYDLNLIKHFRLERLRSFFAESLLSCHISLNCRRVLVVYSSDFSVIDKLLNELEDLGYYAELVLGAKAIALYFAQEEIYRAEVYSIQRPTL